MPMQTGDCVLLCSDGLTNHVSNAELERVVAEVEPSRLPQALIAMANERGGYDNITVIVGLIDSPS